MITEELRSEFSKLEEFYRWCVDCGRPRDFTMRHLARYIEVGREFKRIESELYLKKKTVVRALLAGMADLAAERLPEGFATIRQYLPLLEGEICALLDDLDALAELWMHLPEDDPVESSPFYAKYQLALTKIREV